MMPQTKINLDDFMLAARALSGLPYIFGYEESYKDPTPEAFDCSEMIEFLHEKLSDGAIDFPDGVVNQFPFYRAHGTLISLEEGLKTRGAILIRVAGTQGLGAHTGISRGNGLTWEARGSAYGCGSFSATEGRVWSHAALSPYIEYHPTHKPPKPKMIEHYVIFGKFGGRKGSGDTLDKVQPFLREALRKRDVAIVAQLVEPQRLKKISDDLETWVAEKRKKK